MNETGGIQVSGVRRAFGSVQAVDNIDLQARPGEVTALVARTAPAGRRSC